MATRRITFEKNISPLDPTRAPRTLCTGWLQGTAAANADLRSRGANMNPAVLTQKSTLWDYLTCPRSAAEVAAYEEADRAGVARPIVFDAAVAELAFDAAVAEEAAVAAEASGSSVAGGAEEPLLSDNVAEGSQPDVADVLLPSMSKRMRAEVSEKTVGDPLEWHCIGKRQKTDSSAVADKESSAVADGVARKGGQVVNKGRTLGVQVVDCMFLVKRREDVDEEESSQNTAMQFGSPAKGRYVCPHGAECEDFDCPCKDFGLLWQQARKVGKGKDRRGGRAAPKKYRKANTKEKGKPAVDQSRVYQRVVEFVPGLLAEAEEKVLEEADGLVCWRRLCEAIHASHSLRYRGVWCWCQHCGRCTRSIHHGRILGLRKPCAQPTQGGRIALKRIARGVPPELRALWLDGTDGGEPEDPV